MTLGVVLALLGLIGWRPRLCLALGTPLYLSYAVMSRTFLSFQWDNLLIECGALAVLLPRDRRSRVAHLLMTAVLFKLYWESGVAKWQSHLRDWQDGSAMTFYYQTAPLPTALAWLMHRLPVAWHHLESWLTLIIELPLPFLVFAPWRRVRLGCAAVLTGFQILNALTANYGFFCWLATALHLFLLDDQDLVNAQAWLRRTLRRPPARGSEPRLASRRHELALALCVGLPFVVCSLTEGLVHFAGSVEWVRAVDPLRRCYAPFRVFNAYHLFGHITRERIEPELQTLEGGRWSARDLRYKAGDPSRRPGWVAPHQPRLDFQLWFYGLDYARGTPTYVVNLLDRLCNDPDAVQGLFAAPLPAHPEAVRIVFWDYRFSRAGGPRWWVRSERDETRAIPCRR